MLFYRETLIFFPQVMSFKSYQSYTYMGENALVTAKANRKFSSFSVIPLPRENCH